MHAAIYCASETMALANDLLRTRWAEEERKAIERQTDDDTQRAEIESRVTDHD